MPRQVDHDARLATLSGAVRAIAIRDGFGAVTIRRVAAEAGASTSVVTHYVPSRDELIRSVVSREVTARQDEMERAVQGLRGAAGLRAVVEWAVLGPADDAHRFWLAVVVGAQSDHVLRAELDGFNLWWSALLNDLVAQMEPVPAAPDLLVDAVDVVVDGMIVVGFDGRESWSVQRRRRVLDALLAPYRVERLGR